MSEENKALINRYFECAGNPNYSAMIDQVCSADYVHHNPNHPVPDADLEAHKQIMGEGLMVAFPDLRTTVEEMVAEGDRVAARWAFHGTHNGELPGNPPLLPTGKQISVTAISVHRIAGGKITEAWVNMDAMGMMQQLGAIPTE